MITLIDRGSRLLVLRIGPDDSALDKVGFVDKKSLDPGDEVMTALSDDERFELDELIGLLRSKNESQADLDVSRFPDVIRSVVSFITSARGTKAQRRFLAESLRSANWQVVKHLKETSETPSSS